jgi:two-component system, NtrC family, sensor kinase
VAEPSSCPTERCSIRDHHHAISPSIPANYRVLLAIDRLVEDLRRFTTHRVGETVDADLRDVVAVDLFQATRRGRIEVQADLASVPALPVDRGQVQQVVLNVLNNSAEAMPAGGPVRIATRAVPGGGEIEVEDHGTGLPPEVEAQLFRPFFTTKPDGTGLGLSSSQRSIEAHGGQIRYQTRPGEGTTFVVFLPGRQRGSGPAPGGPRWRLRSS